MAQGGPLKNSFKNTVPVFRQIPLILHPDSAERWVVLFSGSQQFKQSLQDIQHILNGQEEPRPEVQSKIESIRED